MKHYPHHIGDFDRATRHLTRLERSVYRDMMDMYYDTETRLPPDLTAICRKIIARTNEEVTAVEQVLNEFFNTTPTGYWHERCEIEIEAYRSNCSQKALAGKASAAKKAAAKELALNGKSTAVEQPLNAVATAGNGASTNHKPSTNNHISPLPPSGETKAKSVRGTRLPENWGLDGTHDTGMTEEVRSAAKQLKTELEADWTSGTVRYHLNEFRNHFHASAQRNAVKLDWLAAWRNWCSKAMREMPSADPVRRDRQAAAARQAEAVAA